MNSHEQTALAHSGPALDTIGTVAQRVLHTEPKYFINLPSELRRLCYNELMAEDQVVNIIEIENKKGYMTTGIMGAIAMTHPILALEVQDWLKSRQDLRIAPGCGIFDPQRTTFVLSFDFLTLHAAAEDVRLAFIRITRFLTSSMLQKTVQHLQIDVKAVLLCDCWLVVFLKAFWPCLHEFRKLKSVDIAFKNELGAAGNPCGHTCILKTPSIWLGLFFMSEMDFCIFRCKCCTRPQLSMSVDGFRKPWHGDRQRELQLSRTVHRRRTAWPEGKSTTAALKRFMEFYLPHWKIS
jgi:hypothetical protein